MKTNLKSYDVLCCLKPTLCDQVRYHNRYSFLPLYPLTIRYFPLVMQGRHRASASSSYHIQSTEDSTHKFTDSIEGLGYATQHLKGIDSAYSKEGKGFTSPIKTKINFPETKNKKLKHKIHYLHAFWRLNIGDLDFSLSTQLLLNKFGINSVYNLQHFILKSEKLDLFSKEQQNEITKTYYKFGFNSPFVE